MFLFNKMFAWNDIYRISVIMHYAVDHDDMRKNIQFLVGWGTGLVTILFFFFFLGGGGGR